MSPFGDKNMQAVPVRTAMVLPASYAHSAGVYKRENTDKKLKVPAVLWCCGGQWLQIIRASFCSLSDIDFFL